ncbi:MAG TPA: diacylglycerol kinase family protein [Acidimicrobiales bacterium]|nr:diacylglycerol kinase family protein [Acidimicrobiales bacterium]
MATPRAAAIAALVTFISAVASFVAAVALDGLVVLVVGTVLGAIGVTGAWYALSRRGPVRVIGGLVALGALIGLVLLGVAGGWAALLLLLTAVLASISAQSARFALRRKGTGAGAGGTTVAVAARPQRPVLFMNPKSGGGKVGRFHLVDVCAERGIEAVLLQPGDDLASLAEDAIRRGADVVGMAGGDGSQATVATVAARHGVPHVCIPAGTRNHFARDIGLDIDDVVGALDAFHNGGERRVDLARVNGRVFVNNATLGLYAKIVQSPEYRDAKVKTAATMLPDLLGPTAAPFPLRFTGPDGTEYETAHVILVSNNPYRLSSLAGLGTRDSLDSGLLGLLALRIANAAEAAAFVGLETAGQVRAFGGWQEWTAPTFTVGSDDEVEIGIDGEAASMAPPLVFECLPGALRLRLPPHARPPANGDAGLSAESLRALVSTAFGRPRQPA